MLLNCSTHANRFHVGDSVNRLNNSMSSGQKRIKINLRLHTIYIYISQDTNFLFTDLFVLAGLITVL